MLTGGQRGGKAWHRQQARLPGGDLALKFPAEPCAPRDGGSESAGRGGGAFVWAQGSRDLCPPLTVKPLPR